MNEWLRTGAVVEVIVALVAIEAMLLVYLRRRLGRGPSVSAIVANLAAGASLLLAMRVALQGGPPALIGAWLVAALIAHITDLRIRWLETHRPGRYPYETSA
jgi:amino acid transporter